MPDSLSNDAYKDVTSAVIYLPSNLLSSRIKRDNLGPLLQQEVELRIAQLHGFCCDIWGAVKAVNTGEMAKASTAKGQRPNTKANDGIWTLDHLKGSFVNLHNEAFARLVRIGQKMGEEYYYRFQRLEDKDLQRKHTLGGRQLGDSHRTDGSLWTGAGRALTGAGPSGAFEDGDDNEESKGKLVWLVIGCY
jgi:hypothetical protein